MPIGNRMQNQLEELLTAGAAIEVPAVGKTPNQLLDLAVCAKRNGGHLTLTGVGSYTHIQLIELARTGAGHITLKD